MNHEMVTTKKKPLRALRVQISVTWWGSCNVGMEGVCPEVQANGLPVRKATPNSTDTVKTIISKIDNLHTQIMLMNQDNFTDTRLLRIQRQNSWKKKGTQTLNFTEAIVPTKAFSQGIPWSHLVWVLSSPGRFGTGKRTWPGPSLGCLWARGSSRGASTAFWDWGRKTGDITKCFLVLVGVIFVWWCLNSFHTLSVPIPLQAVDHRGWIWGTEQPPHSPSPLPSQFLNVWLAKTATKAQKEAEEE